MLERGFTIPAEDVEAALGRGVLRAVERRRLDDARRTLLDAMARLSWLRAFEKMRASQPDPRIVGAFQCNVTVRTAPLLRIQGDFGG
ncbi:hypothetical protein WMF30_10240 [Sorangium sp. So ce134]